MLSGQEKMKLLSKVGARCNIYEIVHVACVRTEVSGLKHYGYITLLGKRYSHRPMNIQGLGTQPLPPTSRIRPAGVSHAPNQGRTKTPPRALTQTLNQLRSVHKEEAMAAQHLRTAFPGSAEIAGCDRMAQRKSSPALVHRK